MNRNTPLTKKKKSKHTVFEKIIGYTASFIGFMIGRYLGLLGILIFFITIAIGLKFPDWYMKKTNPNHKLIKWIIWSNIATWLFPPLGILTGFCAIGFGDFITQQKIKYRILGVIGIVLAFANSFTGILLYQLHH